MVIRGRVAVLMENSVIFLSVNILDIIIHH